MILRRLPLSSEQLPACSLFPQYRAHAACTTQDLVRRATPGEVPHVNCAFSGPLLRNRSRRTAISELESRQIGHTATADDRFNTLPYIECEDGNPEHRAGAADPRFADAGKAGPLDVDIVLVAVPQHRTSPLRTSCNRSCVRRTARGDVRSSCRVAGQALAPEDRSRTGFAPCYTRRPIAAGQRWSFSHGARTLWNRAPIMLQGSARVGAGVTGPSDRGVG